MTPARARGSRGPEERRGPGTRYPRGGGGSGGSRGIGTDPPPPRLVGHWAALDNALSGVEACPPPHKKVGSEIGFLVGEMRLGGPDVPWWAGAASGGKEGIWEWDLRL